MKRIIFILGLCFILALSFTALAAEKVGISMPDQTIQRWTQDGSSMKKELEALGYQVDLQYADGDIARQVSQLENMLMGGCQLLVITPLDGSALGSVLDMAQMLNVKVIAYDRLLMQTNSVDYYVTFDNEQVGRLQGQYIVEKLGLDQGKGPYNMEIVSGSPDDNNSLYFYSGAMEMLTPYLDSGMLRVPSGQIDFNVTATMRWRTEEAQARFDNLITGYYADGTKLDAVLAAADVVGLGVINSLNNSGFQDFPLIVGQDCATAVIPYLVSGQLTMSIFKDTRILAAQLAQMANDVLQGKEPQTNNNETYHNGVKIVPTYLCIPQVIDKENYLQALIESGYYTLADIGQ